LDSLCWSDLLFKQVKEKCSPACCWFLLLCCVPVLIVCTFAYNFINGCARYRGRGQSTQDAKPSPKKMLLSKNSAVNVRTKLIVSGREVEAGGACRARFGKNQCQEQSLGVDRGYKSGL